MKQKTPDEQIKEFEQKADLYAKLTRKPVKWWHIPLLFALIIDLACLLTIPPLITILLLKTLGVM
jgi:hypothetical protein